VNRVVRYNNVPVLLHSWFPSWLSIFFFAAALGQTFITVAVIFQHRFSFNPTTYFIQFLLSDYFNHNIAKEQTEVHRKDVNVALDLYLLSAV
jgi:hypothetical protein